MRIAIVGRTEILYNTAIMLRNNGYEIGLIITAKEAPEYTKTASDFAALANSWDIPFIQTPRIEEAIDKIKLIPQIDIGISLNYSGVIPSSVIDIFPLGILNAHGGDLPKYRGNACQAWAIINGENKVGLCIHRMIGGELDSGDIITREYFNLNLDTKVTEIYQWMSKRVPVLFCDALSSLNKNPNFILERQSKNPSDALRCYPRKPEDGRINWNKSAIEILRLINACNKPYAGAFCYFNDQKIIIWDANLATEENFLAAPGQVTLVESRFVEVATGHGKLRINEIEVSGEFIAPNSIISSLRCRFS